MNSRKKSLVKDKQGAVMVIGLFMAVALAGSLWFIMGIGEAIYTRDHAMEAADHAIFSAAVAHARGMNYISALNLVMFALTVIFVAITLLGDLFIIAAGLLAATILFAELAPPVYEIGVDILSVAEAYNDALKVILPAMSLLEDVITVGSPIAAEAMAVKIGKEYTYTSFFIGPSLIPGLSHSVDVIGLPVKKKKFQYLCDRTFAMVINALPLGGGVVGRFLKKALKKISEGVFDTLPSVIPEILSGCGGDPWKQSGPHVVDDAVKNGTDYLQMWGLVTDAKDTDPGKAETKISVAGTKGFGGKGQTDPGTHIYYAQSEYYFDCKKAWSDDSCNGPDDVRTASFSMRWRARLRRVRAPSFGNQIVGQIGEFVLAGNLQNFIAGKVAGIPGVAGLAGKLQGVMNGPIGSVLTRTGPGNTTNGAINFLTGGDKPIH